MITLSKQQLTDIDKHALDSYPNEMVGLVIGDQYIRLQNVHENPEKSFKIDMVEFHQYIDDVECIVHSHTKSVKDAMMVDLRTPSYKDFINQKKSGIPWLIVGTEGENVLPPIELPRTPSNKYTRRRFMWYINDCYTIVQDYYKFELGIELLDGADDFDWESEDAAENMFNKYASVYGFVDVLSVDDLQQGDILLLKGINGTFNHLGIYEDGYVIEQMGISIRRPIVNYISNIKRILRYENISI